METKGRGYDSRILRIFQSKGYIRVEIVGGFSLDFLSGKYTKTHSASIGWKHLVSMETTSIVLFFHTLSYAPLYHSYLRIIHTFWITRSLPAFLLERKTISIRSAEFIQISYHSLAFDDCAAGHKYYKTNSKGGRSFFCRWKFQCAGIWRSFIHIRCPRCVFWQLVLLTSCKIWRNHGGLIHLKYFTTSHETTDLKASLQNEERLM